MDRTALVRRGRKIELLRLSLWFLLSPKRVLTRCVGGRYSVQWPTRAEESFLYATTRQSTYVLCFPRIPIPDPFEPLSI